MPTLRELSQHQGVRWGALVALLVGMTQFDAGFKLFARKWTADEAAAEAKKVAVEAKETANGVEMRFDQYIQQQKQAIETQNKVAEAIQAYAARQQPAPNQPFVPPPTSTQPPPSTQLPPLVRIDQDSQGHWYCWDGTRSWWVNEKGLCE